MGYRLYREVLDHAPADLTPAERLVLAVLADFARDDTREAWPGIEWLAHRCGMTARGVRNALARLATRGYDVRVVLGKDKNGRPVYSHHGRRTIYRVPKFPRRTLPKGGTTVPPSDSERRHESDRKAARDGHEGGTTVPPLSSGSTQEPSAAGRAAQLVANKTDATDAEAAAVVALIERERQPRSIAGLVARLAADGDLDEWLAKVRANGRRAELAAWVASLASLPECPHGVPGGDQRRPDTGQPQCALCRRST